MEKVEKSARSSSGASCKAERDGVEPASKLFLIHQRRNSLFRSDFPSKHGRGIKKRSRVCAAFRTSVSDVCGSVSDVCASQTSEILSQTSALPPFAFYRPCDFSSYRSLSLKRLSQYEVGPPFRSHEQRNRRDCFTFVSFRLGTDQNRRAYTGT